MGSTLTIVDTGFASLEALVPDIEQIIARHGQAAVDHLRTSLWNEKRFVYAGIKPRPSASKSGEAWTQTTEAIIRGVSYSLTLSNGATNRYGTYYVPYVHIAGKPRTDTLTREVDTYMKDVTIPAILEEIGKRAAVVASPVQRAARYGD